MKHKLQVRAEAELDLERRCGMKSDETSVQRQVKLLRLDEAFDKATHKGTKYFEAELCKRAGVRSGDLESIRENSTVKKSSGAKSATQIRADAEIELDQRAGNITVKEAALAKEHAENQAAAEKDVKEFMAAYEKELNEDAEAEESKKGPVKYYIDNLDDLTGHVVS